MSVCVCLLKYMFHDVIFTELYLKTPRLLKAFGAGNALSTALKKIASFKTDITQLAFLLLSCLTKLVEKVRLHCFI